MKNVCGVLIYTKVFIKYNVAQQ